MSALLKVYTDSGHSSEVAHTTQNSSTIETGHAASAGDTVLYITSTTGMPTQGYIDIVDTGKNETIAYYGLSGNTVNVANTGGLAYAHSTGVTLNQWYYQLAVGDQTNGIPNDGTNASPNSPTNVATWYCYNAGDQTAQSPTLATVSGAPSTGTGYTDTLISITSASAGFAASVSPSNIASGSQQQFWVVAEIANGQSAAGNPQICVIDISYQSI
jgi:hypothetical protein